MNVRRIAVAMWLAPLAAVGCSSAQKAGCSSCRNTTKPTVSIVQETPPAARQLWPQPAASPVASRETPAVAPHATSQASPGLAVVGAPAANQPAPKPSPAAEPRPIEPALVSAAEVKVSEAPAPVPAPAEVVVPAAKQEPTGYFHNDDYSELAGELHHNVRTDEWRLRYAGLDVEDPYGGSVTLIDPAHLLKDCATGQHIRIQGQLVNRAARTPSPDFTVRGIVPAQSR